MARLLSKFNRGSIFSNFSEFRPLLISYKEYFFVGWLESFQTLLRKKLCVKCQIVGLTSARAALHPLGHIFGHFSHGKWDNYIAWTWQIYYTLAMVTHIIWKILSCYRPYWRSSDIINVWKRTWFAGLDYYKCYRVPKNS